MQDMQGMQQETNRLADTNADGRAITLIFRNLRPR